MRYPRLKYLIILGLGTFYATQAFTSITNVFSEILRDAGMNDLGFYSMATMYLACGLSAFVGSSYVSKFGCLHSFLMGNISMALFFVSGYLCLYDELNKAML